MSVDVVLDNVVGLANRLGLPPTTKADEGYMILTTTVAAARNDSIMACGDDRRRVVKGSKLK